MATMNRAAIARQLDKRINAVFGQYKDRPLEYPQVFDAESTDRAFVEEVLMTGLGFATVKPEGRGVNYDSAKESYVARYDVITLALAISITQEAIEDNLHIKLAGKAGQWLERAHRNTKEIMAANVLNYGFDATRPIGDGASLFSTQHPVTGGGYQQNCLSTPADLTESSLEDILVLLSQMKDDRGMIVGAMPKRLIIPPQLVFVAQRLLASQLRTATTDNDINAIRSLGIFTGEPVVMRRLTSSTAWFIKTDIPDGLKFITRIPLGTVQNTDFETDSMRWRTRERVAVGVSDWRGCLASQ